MAPGQATEQEQSVAPPHDHVSSRLRSGRVKGSGALTEPEKSDQSPEAWKPRNLNIPVFMFGGASHQRTACDKASRATGSGRCASDGSGKTMVNTDAASNQQIDWATILLGDAAQENQQIRYAVAPASGLFFAETSQALGAPSRLPAIGGSAQHPLGSRLHAASSWYGPVPSAIVKAGANGAPAQPFVTDASVDSTGPSIVLVTSNAAAEAAQ